MRVSAASAKFLALGSERNIWVTAAVAAVLAAVVAAVLLAAGTAEH